MSIFQAFYSWCPWNCFCCCWNCICCWCIILSKSVCCCCFSFFRWSSFSLISAFVCALSFRYSLAPTVGLLLRFVLSSLSSSFFSFFGVGKPFHSFHSYIFCFSSVIFLLHVSLGALSSRVIIWCIRSSNSLGSSGDIRDALSLALIFFLCLPRRWCGPGWPCGQH